MGIESDHLVYEYLSRVGDLAQRRHLSSGDRMRLVSGLRDEIDRRRAKYEPETPAAVRRILERIGTPEEVLDTLSAAPGPAAAPVPPVAPGVPAQRGPHRRTSPDSTNWGRASGWSPTGGGSRRSRRWRGSRAVSRSRSC